MQQVAAGWWVNPGTFEVDGRTQKPAVSVRRFAPLNRASNDSLRRRPPMVTDRISAVDLIFLMGRENAAHGTARRVQSGLSARFAQYCMSCNAPRFSESAWPSAIPETALLPKRGWT